MPSGAGVGTNEIFSVAKWKTSFLAFLTLICVGGFIVGAIWLLLVDVVLWRLAGSLLLAALLVFLLLDRLALDVGTVITVTPSGLRYQPGSFIWKNMVRSGSSYEPKDLRWDEWDFTWRQEIRQDLRYLVNVWVVEAVSRNDRLRVVSFLVPADLVDLVRLRQITTVRSSQK